MNTPARIGKPAAVPPPYPGGPYLLSAAGEGKIQREPSHSRRSPAFPGKAAPHASSAVSIKKGGAPHRFAPPFAISHHSVLYILYGIFLSQYIRDIRTPAAQALANMWDALPRKPWSRCRTHPSASSATMVRTIPLARAARSSAWLLSMKGLNSKQPKSVRPACSGAAAKGNKRLGLPIQRPLGSTHALCGKAVREKKISSPC